MDFLFNDIRDPIFGLIVLVFSILVVILLSYFWGIFAKKNNNEHIEKFLQKFDSQNDNIIAMLSTLESNDLLLIASGLSRLGDWQNAIKFYEKAIKNTKEISLKINILHSLADAYTKIGFLERAKDVYSELLGIMPRNTDALFKLIFVCEKLKDFSYAMQCLEILENINGKNDEIRSYLLAIEILNKTDDIKEKLTKLKNLTQTSLIKRFILELSLQNFENFDKQSLPPLEFCIDLLGEKSEEFFNLDVNDKNYFNLKILKISKQNKIKAKFEFTYVCKECKQTYPVFFARCPKCLKIGTIVAKSTLIPQ